MGKNKFKLYFTAGTTDIGKQDFLTVLRTALESGITAFQLQERGKNALVGEELKALIEQCKALCRTYQVPLLLANEVALALELDVAGVHIEQRKVDLREVRTRIGADKILGVTVESLEEAFTASDAGVDYIGIGPASGVSAVDVPSLIGKVIRELPGLPIIGMGDIAERKVGTVIRAGASGVAVTSKILVEDDLEVALKNLKGRLLLSLTGVEM